MKHTFLLLLLICLVGYSHARTICGTVYDDNTRKPLTGVVVKTPGNTTGVTTDAKGFYTVAIDNAATSLYYMCTGYSTQRIMMGATDTINVRLEHNDSVIVLCAYPMARRKYVTGDAAGYAAANNALYSAPTLSKAFMGRVAGVSLGYTKDKAENAQWQPAATDNEAYQGVAENGFTNPVETPLSTFAVDVDAAGYSNVRRYINNGQLPPKDAVRIEEMINYFHYQLPVPVPGDPVAIQTELSSAPWSPQHRLLRIGLKAKTVETAKLPPSNLVFLIDVSGSMNDNNKLPLVKSAMKMLVDQLRPIDKVSLVVYAGEVAIKLEPTPGDAKMKIKNAIDALGAGGGTAGGAGITIAYELAKKQYIKGGNNRIILATDGDFNIGPSSDKDMLTLIEQERNSGISISILGFGMGNLKDSKMELMADKGHGNYAYIDNLTEATRCMVTEFGGTLFTVAKDVKLQIEFNPAKVQAYRLIGYENRLLNKEDFNNDKKPGGDMGVGHTITALYEIVPTGIKDPILSNVDPLKYQPDLKQVSTNNATEMVTIKFRYKEPNNEKSKLQQAVVNDTPVPISQTSEDYRFASSVAEFGLLLRNSELKQQANYKALISRARSARGKDEDGYRAEFIRLAESARSLNRSTETVMEAGE